MEKVRNMFPIQKRLFFFGLVCLLGLLPACYDIETLQPFVDSRPPEAISLRVAALNPDEEDPTKLHLSFPAPWDSGTKIAQYDIGYSTERFAASDTTTFAKTKKLAVESEPKDYGNREFFTITGLLEDTTYYVGVRSEDQAGNRSPLVVLEAKTLDVTPPFSPTGFTVTNPKTGHSLQLSWDNAEASDLAGFLLVRKEGEKPQDETDGVNIEITFDMMESPYDFFLDQRGVIAGETYHYLLYAVDDDGLLSENPPNASAQCFECKTDSECFIEEYEDFRPLYCDNYECKIFCESDEECVEWNPLYPVCVGRQCSTECNEAEGRNCKNYEESCNSRGECSPYPILENIAPDRLETSTIITLTGEHFTDEIGGVKVIFEPSDGLGFFYQAEVLSANETTIEAEIPQGALQGASSGFFDCHVEIFDVPSNDLRNLQIYAKYPLIERIEPREAKRGEAITITGDNFTMNDAVETNVHFPTLNATPCEVAVTPNSDSELQVIVPTCAKSGKLSVIVDEIETFETTERLFVTESIETSLSFEQNTVLAADVSRDGKLLFIVTQTELMTHWILEGRMEAPIVSTWYYRLASMKTRRDATDIYLASVDTPFIDKHTFIIEESSETGNEELSHSHETLTCTSPHCPTGAIQKIIADPKNHRLLLIADGRLYRYDERTDEIAPLTASTLEVQDAKLGGLSQYVYVTIALNDDSGYRLAAYYVEPPSGHNTLVTEEITRGSGGLIFTPGQTGKLLYVADTNEPAPQRLYPFDIVNPASPIAKTPINLSNPIKKITVSYDDKTLYLLDDAGEVQKLTDIENHPTTTSFDTTFNAQSLSLRATPDGQRLLLRALDNVQLFTLAAPSPVYKNISTNWALARESFKILLDNAPCRSDDNVIMRSVTNASEPFTLHPTEEKRYQGVLPSDWTSGSFTLACEGTNPSAEYALQIQQKHDYAADGFLDAWTIDEIVPMDADGRALILVNYAPGEVGMVSSGDDMSDFERAGFTDDNSNVILDADIYQNTLYLLRWNTGLEAYTIDLFSEENYTLEASDLPSPVLPGAMAIDQDQGIIIMSDKLNDDLLFLDIETNETETLALQDCQRPTKLLLHEGWIFAACEESQSIVSVNRETHAFADSISLETSPMSIHASNATNLFVVIENEIINLPFIPLSGEFQDPGQRFTFSEQPIFVGYEDGFFAGFEGSLTQYNEEFPHRFLQVLNASNTIHSGISTFGRTIFSSSDTRLIIIR